MFILTDPRAWAEENFGGCQLGDSRRTKRLIKLADGLARHPGGSLLHSCAGDAAAGVYRLLRNDTIEADAILAGGYLTTVRRAHPCEVLLALEDTTYLSYRHRVVKELGDIGGQAETKSKGFVVHSILLVDGRNGETVGLAEQQRWTRASAERGKKHRRKQRAYQEKESFKGQRAGEALRARLGPALSQRVIPVCDREADISAYLRWQHSVAGRYVVRAAADRVLCGHTQPLWPTLEAAPLLGEHRVEVARRGGRPARQARVSIRVQTVTLQAAKPITCTALLAREDAAPDGMEPLDILWIYSRRWRIEDFHNAWKSGVGVEALRARSANNLERGAVILALMAVRLLQLQELAAPARARPSHRAMALPEPTCDQVLSEGEWQVLYTTTTKAPLPAQPPRARWAYHTLAKLGGWADTQRTGRPGWEAVGADSSASPNGSKDIEPLSRSEGDLINRQNKRQGREEQFLAPPVDPSPATLPLDVNKYQDHLADFDLTEEQKHELLHTLWKIIAAFVDLGFGIDPVQILQSGGAAEPMKSAANAVESKKLPHRLNSVPCEPKSKEDSR